MTLTPGQSLVRTRDKHLNTRGMSSFMRGRPSRPPHNPDAQRALEGLTTPRLSPTRRPPAIQVPTLGIS
jgi:hypothetical protein